MFGWLAKKKLVLNAPCDGEIVELENVNDEVFSKKMVGDGVALLPKGDTICSPARGVITKIFPTCHAFVLKADKVEIIVHIGIDTVKLKGEGFRALVSQGEEVGAGEPIISIDRAFLEASGVDLTTPIVVNRAVNILVSGFVNRGESIMEVVL